jgi:DNA-binding SARP family transcriptional activator
MLLLARGRQVSLDALVDGVWGADVPRSAGPTIRTYVSRLRRSMDAASAGEGRRLIESVGDGYVLRLGPAFLDLDAFELWLSGAREARQRNDTARGARLLRDALGLWRGNALAGVPGPYADSRRVTLAELHLAATEEKLTLDIALGDHAAAIAELRGLLAAHSFREGLSELLMLALYKSGRQAEALDVFDATRQRLRTGLGIDPGPSLRTLHQRVLRADGRLLGGVPPRPSARGAVHVR